MASVFKRSCDKGRRGSKWYIKWHDHQTGQWKTRVGYTDKAASRAEGDRLELDSLRRATGVGLSSTDEQSLRSINEHVHDYIEILRGGNRAPRYVDQVESKISRVLNATNAKRLCDLDSARITRFLASITKKNSDGTTHPISTITRNEYVLALKAFSKWCLEEGRIERDPLVTLRRVERKNTVRTHQRRALTWEELSKLLAATVQRPVDELLTIRTGPNAGKKNAKAKPSSLKAAQEKGRERRLCYMLAALAGLRRSEIKQLEWRDLDLEGAVPRITLRAATTKSKRSDRLVLHSQLAIELAEYRGDSSEDDQRVVAAVPDMKAMKADLNAAGVEYEDEEGRLCDFHSLRMSLSTKMAASGMSQRVRQSHMRHTDPRLTEGAYMDEGLLPMAAELTKVPAIPNADQKPPMSYPLQATGTENHFESCQSSTNPAHHDAHQSLRKTPDISGQVRTGIGLMNGSIEHGSKRVKPPQNPANYTKTNDPSRTRLGSEDKAGEQI